MLGVAGNALWTAVTDRAEATVSPPTKLVAENASSDSGNAEACDDIQFDIMSASALRARYLRRGISITLKERRKQSGLAISARE
jgi:hypothetical protein